MSIKEQIEAEAKKVAEESVAEWRETADRDKGYGALLWWIGESGYYNTNKLHWMAGALWAMRWWAERMNRLENLTNKDDDEEMRLLKEMDAAAEEVLG